MHAVSNNLMACLSVIARCHEPCRDHRMTGVCETQCAFTLGSLYLLVCWLSCLIELGWGNLVKLFYYIMLSVAASISPFPPKKGLLL